MKIAHLAQDEKFLPLARSMFEEAFPGANSFVVCRRRRAVPTFLKPEAQVRYRRSLVFRLPWLMPELRGADIVVVHAMTKPHARALRGVSKDSLVVWIGYGFDYYGLLSQAIGGYWFDKTDALLSQLNLKDGELRAMRPHVARVVGRIDVFSVNPSEAEMLRAALPALESATFHPLPSFTVEDTFAQGGCAMAGPDVLLGNSASPDNNHLDAFDLLRDTLPAGSGLIVPLSYGIAPYADHIEQAGTQLFGHRFVSLRAWIPIADYQQRISRCGFVVMNHRRQKAVGNMSSALYRGAKVFLPKSNPLFGFFTDLGCVVFPVEMLRTDPASAWQPLTEDIQRSNRQAIDNRFGRARVLERIRALEGFRAQRRPAP